MTADSVPHASRPRQIRTCNGCGEQLDVTELLPRRGYRCHQCGTILMHLPGLAEQDSGAKFRQPFWTFRLVLAMLLPAGLVWLAAWVGHMSVTTNLMLSVMAGAAIVSILGCLWARRLSHDGVGLVGVMLTAAGIGAAALLAVAELPEPARANAPVLLALAWLGLGGSQLARFTRRLRLPNIGPQGIIRGG